MLTLVIYDISNNHERNQLIKTLQHYGLHRIQKSAFLGNLDKNRRSKLENNLPPHISSSDDSIYIVPICDKCKELTRIFSEEKKVLEEMEDYKII